LCVRNASTPVDGYNIHDMKMDRGEFLFTILDSIADGVFTIDNDKNITSFNRAAERITGYTRDEAIGSKCYEIFHANICQTQCALEKTLETGEPIVDMQLNIVSRSGKTMPISISTGVLKTKDGKVEGGVETFRDLSALEELRKEIRGRYTFEDIVSKNHEIQQIFRIMPDIAESGSTVLIEGESGTGKELFARAIHNLGPRRDGPYVAVNCGALPDSLLESELFGYKKGAFTDARADKPGRFESAQGGTIFLDEVADISPVSQVKLLRVLQEKEYEPLGSTRTKTTDARVIAATNRKLSEEVKAGRFRTDLFYRLNVVRIELPPLRRRREDIPLLVEHFRNRFNLRMGKNIIGISEESMELLMNYSFPGNVRELENIIEHAFVLCRGPRIGVKHLPPEMLSGEVKQISAERAPEDQESPLERAEEKAITEALAENGGNRKKTAESLGISKATLWRKMKKYGINC